MKKTIVAILSFAFVLIWSQAVSASNLFNGQAEDCSPSIGIGNYTTGNILRDSYGCWRSSSISANAGDTINIALYYHNSTSITLTNVKSYVTKSSSGPATSYSFTGVMTSDQGSQTIGTVNLNLTSSQTLTYSSTHLMKGSADVLADRDTLVVKDEGGISVGSVANGNNDYGTIVFVYKVGNSVNPTPDNYCTINNFSASPTTINAGDISTLSWNTSNCNNVSIYPTLGSVNSSGSHSVFPGSSTTYTITADGIQRVAIINVNQYNPNPVDNCTINSFYASPTTIYDSGYSNLYWNTSNCNSVTISNLGYNVPVSGNQQVWLSNTRTYILTAYGPYGGSRSKSVTIYVEDDNNNYNTCRITNFDADDTSIDEGDTTVLRWNTENCNSTSITDIGSVSRNGSYRINPGYTRTYTLRAYGNNGSDSDSIKIYVDDNNNNNNYNYNTPSASTYSPKNVDTNSAILSGHVGGNGSRINSWFEFPCYGTKYGQKYNQTSGNITANVYSLNQNTTYSYCAVAQNVSNGNTVRGNTVTFRTNGNYVAPVSSCAVTTIATNIDKTTAQLNGLISGGSGGSSYFEYGTSVNLGQRTISRYSSSGTNFSDSISGLSPNTIYYFRLVSDCGSGLSYGSVEVFRTDAIQIANTVTKTVYVKQGTTVVGTKSPVLLTISNKYKMISAGDLVDYVVTYKNIGSVTLLKPMIQVVLPTNMTLVNSSRGTYSIDTHTLSAQVEDLTAGQEGSIYLQAKVDSIPLNNSNIPTTAIFIYTSSTGSQENAMAYVVNNPLVDASTTTVTEEENSTLGGAALFGSMGSIGLVGWLIIILLILVLILVARSFYDKNQGGPTIHGPAH